MITKPINTNKIPQVFLDKFKPSENPNFIEDVFDKKVRDQIAQYDPIYRASLYFDSTTDFNKWLNDKRSIKKNTSINIKGDTRGGKSLVGLKIADNNSRYYNKPFKIDYIVCGNQREYRMKLDKAEFGDSFLIDENAFANVGEGTNAESQQLKDIQNIIAKKNIHTIYITPRQFLDTGAKMGLEYHSTAYNDWLSKFLLYNLKANPLLMGYVIIDVGKLFNDYGCFFNRVLGGCTNPNKLLLKNVTKNNLIFDNYQDKDNPKEEKISIDYLKYSSCIPEDWKQNPKIETLNLKEDDIKSIQCPFYRICQSPMCGYEHKKDTWINKEMRGGLSERKSERYRIVIELIKRAGYYNEDKGGFELEVQNAKQIKPLMDLHLPEITSTKLTISEEKEILNSLISMSNKQIFFKTCEMLELDLKQTLNNIKDGILSLE